MSLLKNHRAIKKFMLMLYQNNAELLLSESSFNVDIPRNHLLIENNKIIEPNRIVEEANNEAHENTSKSEPSSSDNKDSATNQVPIGSHEQTRKFSKYFFDRFFEQYPTISSEEKENYKIFVKLFLHQGVFGIPVMYISSHLLDKNIYTKDIKFEVNITLRGHTIYLTTSYSIAIYNEDNVIINGKTNFKITTELLEEYKTNTGVNTEKKWKVQFGLLDSTLDCTDEYKKTLDTRNYLEKFIDFLTLLIDFLISFTKNKILHIKLSPSQPDLTENLKTTPLFFFYKTVEKKDIPITDSSKSPYIEMKK